MSLIVARDLSIGWSRDAVLLEHASFTVEPGEIFGILGRSASGKSTLFRALIGLEQPLAGEFELTSAPSVPGAPRFGVMFQQGALFGSLTVGENVALPLDRWTDLPPNAVRAIARSKLRLVGLADAMDRMPSQLSGGMRKRAAIARALALEPTLLFLDEPSSGLDPVTSAEIDRLIVTLKRVLGLTVVLVTHELGSIDNIIDRCIMLDAESRSIIASGAPRELHASPNPRVKRFLSREPEAT